MLAISVVYSLLYCLVRFDLRYRYPILWVSLFAAAYAIRPVLFRLAGLLPQRYRAVAQSRSL